MSGKRIKVTKPAGRRRFTREFKEEAIQLLVDGHTAESVAHRLGLKGAQCLYRWKKEILTQSGPIAGSLEGRVRELETELRRVERERDFLKKALAIFSRSE